MDKEKKNFETLPLLRRVLEAIKGKNFIGGKKGSIPKEMEKVGGKKHSQG